MTTSYEAFLRAKFDFHHDYGFVVDPADLSPCLLPHQRDIVVWAIKGGRRALFESFGLGKSVQQLEILRLIIAHLAGEGRRARALIVCPLGVRQEFTRDARDLLGLELRFVRRTDEVDGDGIYLTNYESIRDGRLDPELFDAVSLDEASVLRSYGSKTYQSFLGLFAGTKYRFVATATPSPNRFKELIHYAAFLGVMDSGAALTRWFRRDSTQANNLTLHPHKAEEFWVWLHSWAIFLQSPADLGYSAEGYDLPELEVVWHELPNEAGDGGHERDGQGRIFRDAALGVTAAAREKRDTLPARVAKAKEIVDASPDDHFILWHDLESERHALKAALPDAVEVYGNQDLDTREERIIGFSDGEFRLLATKPILSGSGCNFQRHCHRQVFVGVGFRFQDFIQSIHRSHRYLQKHPVRIDVIYAESEREVVKTLRRKWAQHEELTAQMSDLIRSHGLDQLSIAKALERSLGVERVECSGEGWLLANNDCVAETSAMGDESVDQIVTSIPFGNQYEYVACFDDQTEILTRRGWLSFGSLTPDDYLATVAPDLTLEWDHPTEIMWRPYSGPMYRFRDRNSIDLLVTPDHKMFVDRRVGNLQTGRKVSAFELLSAKMLTTQFAHRKWRMLAALQPGSGDSPGYIEIPAVPQRVMPNSVQVEKIGAEDFMRLAGWYLSEGCVGDPAKTQARGRISISQSDVHPEHRAEIIDLFGRLGLRTNSNHRTNINVTSIRLAAFLRQEFGAGSYNKRIPRWVKDLHPDLLVILRDTMMKGDGNSNGMAYTSYSQQLCDDFQELCLTTGWRASVSGNVVRIGQRNTRPELRARPEVIDYEGMIGCATVPNRTLVVRRNGKVLVTGNSYNDFGHTDDNDHFWAQMDFLTPELLRVLRPGRIYACHVKDRILFGNVTGAGYSTVSPFHAEAIMHGLKHGFEFMGMITVVTDVVRENNQSYRLGWSEMAKDGSKMGVGSPEYVLLFRKPQSDRGRGYADVPVVKDKAVYSRARWQIDAHAFWRTNGNRVLTAEDMRGLSTGQRMKLFEQWELAGVHDHEVHVAIGEQMDGVAGMGVLPATFMMLAPPSPHPDVWTDIHRMRTLNSDQARRNLVMHTCPLQLEIVDRLIERYSNPGDLVYDPFAGLGTVPLRALRAGRRGRGAELNPASFTDSVRYLTAEEMRVGTPSLFDLIDLEAADVEAERVEAVG